MHAAHYTYGDFETFKNSVSEMSSENHTQTVNPNVDYTLFKNEGDLIRNGEEWLQLLHKEPNQTNGDYFYFIARDNDSTDQQDIYIVEGDGDKFSKPMPLAQYQQTMAVPSEVWDEWVNDFLPGSISARHFYVDFDEVLSQPRQVAFNADKTWQPVDNVPEETLALFDQSNIVHATYYAHVDFDAVLNDVNANDKFTEILSSLGVENNEAKQNLLRTLNPDLLKADQSEPILNGSVAASKQVFIAAHPAQGASVATAHKTPAPPLAPQPAPTLNLGQQRTL